MALADCIASGLAWRDGQQVDDRVTADELKDRVAAGDLVWLDLLRPSSSDLEELRALLDLSPAAIEDVTASHDRSKVVRHGTTIFFRVSTADLETSADAPEGRVHSHRISGWVLPQALVTVRMDDAVDMGQVVTRWEDNSDLLRAGVGALVHGLLDHVVDGHFDAIQQLDNEVEELEDELFAERNTGRDFARRVYRFRKDLVALRRIVLPMREVVNALVRHRERNGSELDHWYDDLYDHVLRASEWTESLRDMATTVFETHLSLQDSRLNVVMKKLAGWGAIIAIPTAITGWFGQNIPYPGYLAPLGLWMSVALIVVLAGG
ncbi:MAG: magnesium transporter CorA family protein, partial [Nocardioides sp.]|nr:magnesium transporter CorA family protein [Nocardioides sp.]